MTSPQTKSEPPVLPQQAGESWLTVAAMLADLAFETDCDGRFSAFGPGKVLGQPASRMLGSPLSSVLFLAQVTDDPPAAFRTIIASICGECVSWQGKVRLSPANGTCYRLSLAPRITGGGSVAGIYGLLMQLETIETGLAAEPVFSRVGTMLDSDTGLWSAKTFLEEAARRFDRLDVEELPGTLILLGYSRAPTGLHSAISIRLAEELRDIVRPTDLMGRTSGAVIAIWCDGMDHLTGAERAARFCDTFPALLPGGALITAGVATRWPGSGDDPYTVLERAGVALRLADLATERSAEPAAIGEWRVWQQD